MFKQNRVAAPALCNYWAKEALKTFYPFCQYHGTEDAPNSWKELQRYKYNWKQGASLPVYNGGSIKNIYGGLAGNIVARAWHDCIHLENDLSFTLKDERKVAIIHRQQLQAIRAPSNVIATIWADTAGQVEYYYTHKRFLSDQLAFVHWLVENDNNLSLIAGYSEEEKAA